MKTKKFAIFLKQKKSKIIYGKLPPKGQWKHCKRMKVEIIVKMLPENPAKSEVIEAINQKYGAKTASNEYHNVNF